jgi:similar to spore coat protein
MPRDTISPHETFEVHELITFKAVCATKAATLMQLATDDALIQILQDDVRKTKTGIEDLRGLLQHAPITSAGATTAGTTSTKAH